MPPSVPDRPPSPIVSPRHPISLWIQVTGGWCNLTCSDGLNANWGGDRALRLMEDFDFAHRLEAARPERPRAPARS
jgi:hypothetical protein